MDLLSVTPHKISDFRISLSQILATSAKNLILLDLGMTLAFPTIVIPALLSSSQGLMFTAERASWFGSIVFLCQPVGSIVSGLLFEPLGRKRTMMVVNLPHIVGWLMFHLATTVTELYIAGFLLGIAVGFMEAPILTYVGEISEPRWRGVLASYGLLCYTLGFMLVYFLGTLTDWQTAAAIYCFVPALALLAVSQIPESPVWLLSKGRTDEAERSLCWLRGWATPLHVEKEFRELKQYNQPATTQEQGKLIVDPEHQQSEPRSSLFKALFQKQTVQPFLLNTLLFVFHHAAGITGTRPFMIEIFSEYGSHFDVYVVTLVTSIVGVVGGLLGMILMSKIGKRNIALVSTAGCMICSFVLAGCGFGTINIPMHGNHGSNCVLHYAQLCLEFRTWTDPVGPYQRNISFENPWTCYRDHSSLRLRHRLCLR